jgi:3alpha(or 20beta)-hydroxysteroid dehydrogenase
MESHVALISGGARGIGAAQAEAFLAEGAAVVLGDVLEEEAAQTAERLGDRCLAVGLDVTDEQQWQAAVERCEEAFGRLTTLVNNAGVVHFSSIEETSAADFRRVLDINLTGAFLGISASAPAIRRAGGGCIINISSTAGLAGYPDLSAYVASKWGMRGLTKSAALELARDGIRVNSIHPGPIHTPMTAGMDEATIAANQPIPRFGTPEEVARMARFVAAEATFTTGAEFLIDGGSITGLLPRSG